MRGREGGEPIQSLTIAREKLLDRHLLNMLSVCERVSDHAAGLPAPTAFAAIRQIDTADRLARRQLGLDREDKAKANVLAAFAFSCLADEVSILGDAKFAAGSIEDVCSDGEE